jgi:hypothetical protein
LYLQSEQQLKTDRSGFVSGFFGGLQKRPMEMSLPGQRQIKSFPGLGVVAEWLNAAVLKTAERETVP